MDPIAIRFGDFAISWYWLNYFFALILGFYLCAYMRKWQTNPITDEELVRIFQWGWPGLFVGSRIFYVLFYHPKLFLEHPQAIPKFWLGGMSFHGAMVGIFVTTLIVFRRNFIKTVKFTDLVALVSPLFLFTGRIANYINKELPGRITDISWAMNFPGHEGLRHPSQLYAAIGEGLILGIYLFINRKKLSEPGIISSQFLIGYGSIRFAIGFFRAPDPQLGYLLGPLTLGQIFSFIMILVGVFCYRYFVKNLDNSMG